MKLFFSLQRQAGSRKDDDVNGNEGKDGDGNSSDCNSGDCNSGDGGGSEDEEHKVKSNIFQGQVK